MPTYSVQGPDGKIYEIDGPAGATKAQVVAAIQAKMRASEPAPEPTPSPLIAPPPSTARTTGEAFKDIGASALGGLGSLLQVPGQLAQLIPGLQTAGQYLAKPGEAIEEVGEGLKSAGLKVREQLRSQAISEAEKEGMLSAFGTAIAQTVKDPALLSTFISGQLPQLLGPAAAAKVGKAVVLSRSGLEGAELAAAAGTVGARSAIGAGAAMQGADISSDTYKQALEAARAQGMTEEQANEAALTAARKAFAIAAPISVASQFLPGGAAIERRLAGLPGTGRIRGALGEATQEAIEEGGGAFATNVGVLGIDPTRSLTQGIGSAAGLGAIGGGILGGIIGRPAPAVERPDLAQDQEIRALQAETLELQQARDALAKAFAESEALNAQKAAEEAAKPNVLDRSALDSLISQPNGYSAVTLYREGLKNALKADPANTELKSAIQLADESLEERGIEDARRKEKVQESLSSKNLASFGINSGTVLYKQLVGKNLADEEQRQEIRDGLTAFKADANVKPEQAKKADAVLSYLENYEETRLPYGRKTVPSGDVTETGGAGVSVAGKPIAQPTAGRAGVSPATGVVSPTTPSEQPAGREEAPSNAVTAQTLDSIGISPRSVVRKELIGKAVDDPAVAARLTDLLNNPNIKSKPEVAAKIQEFLGQVKPKEAVEERAAVPSEQAQAPIEEVTTEAPPAKQSIRPKAEPAPAVNLNGRNIPVELSAVDKNAGDVLTTVNTDTFDAAWKSGDKFNNFYIGFGGTGAAIGNRYQQFGNFVNTAKSIEAPTVSVDENGVVAFGNGRHRFAFMRDQGAKAIPVSMSQESFQNAVKAGYVQPAQKKSLREEAATEEEKAQPEAAPSVKERLEQVDKEIAARLEKLGKLLQAKLAKFGLKDVGVQVIKDLEAGGEYANKLIKLAIDVANPIREIRHEAIHALKELGFFTPQQWAVLEKQAKDKWIDEYLKNRNVNMEPLAEGQQSRFDAYQQLFTQEAANRGLAGAEAASYIEEATIEEAIADAFGVFDANKAPPGLMQALLERMRKFFNAVKETFGGTSAETAEDIFRKIEKGEATPTISEPSKSEQAFSLRQRNFENPEDRIEVSTAKPSAAKPVPGEFVPRDPIADLYVIDSADIMSIPAHFAAAHNAISGYNWFPVSTDPDANVRAMKDTIVDNLVWLYDLVPADIRSRAKLWYDGANRIANDWAKGYKYTPQQISGTLAVLSPQKDWFMNVSLAERLISIYTERQNQAWTPAMTAWAESYVKASRSIDTKTSREEVLDAAKRLEGKKLGELSNDDAAYFIRVFDETYNPRQYRVVTPEGQFGGFVGVNEQVDDEATEEGQQAGHVAWGTYDSIAKGVAILRDGSFNNISDSLGEEHKVRNFYNNIVNPKDAIGSVTIDTHAIAAASMKALSGSSLEVLHNFGTTPKAAAGAGGSKLTGASGIYGFVADAYREAAAKVSTPENPVLAREMQSITWEAIRSIFPAAWKRQNAKDVEAVYDQFKQGKITLGEARDRVYKMAGGLKGFAWEGQKQGVYASDGASSFDRSLPKDLEKVQGRTLEPYQIREKISVNLSAAGFEIPGIAFLYSRASSGDMAAYTLLQEMANDSVRFLLAGNETVTIKSIPTSGLFDSFYEPSLNLVISFNEGEREAVLPALRRFSENFQQKQFHVRQRIAMLDPTDLDAAGKHLEKEFSDGSYATPVFTFKLATPLSNQQMANIVNAAGVPGVTFNDNEIITYFVRGSKNETADKFYEQVFRLAEQIGDIATEVNFSAERLWVYGEGKGVAGRYGSIGGKVRPGNPVAPRTAKRVAAYIANVKEKNLKTFEMQEITAEQDAKQTALGDMYDMMPINDLDNPLVKRAYTALSNEVLRQYKALPIRVEWSKKKDKEGRPTDAYGSKSDAMRKDILEYNRLRILPTTPETFGPPGVDFRGHPLLEKTGVMIDGKELVYNDMLRAVHDYYAHSVSRASFGKMGEEAAWKNHMAMTNDPLARWALTTETRAQNSWVNFRSGLDRTIPVKKRPFADQKAGLVPIDFAMTGDAKVDAPMKKLKAELNNKERLGSMSNVKAAPKASLRAPQTEAFKKWFGDSKVVDENGDPLLVYHGTGEDFSIFKYNELKSLGSWFAADPQLAGKYSEIVKRSGKSPSVMPVYLSMQNPANEQDLQKATEKAEKEQNRDYGQINKRRREILQAQGFDGVLLSDTFVVFDPSQIKSAIGNIGTYDVTNPDIRYSLRAPTTAAFKRWFGDSKIVNPDGTPKVMYHGTGKDYTVIGTGRRQAKAIFVTDDPEFAQKFAIDTYNRAAAEAAKGVGVSDEVYQRGVNKAIAQVKKDYKNLPEGRAMIEDIRKGYAQASPEAQEYMRNAFKDELPAGPNILPIYVKAERPFDYDNKDHVNQVVSLMNQDFDSYGRKLGDKEVGDISRGDWETIEKDRVQKAIRDLGFDGFYVKEGGRKSLAVYKSEQLKSATGNLGAYGQRPLEESELRGVGMTAAEAMEAQDRGDMRFSLRAKGQPPTRENVVASMLMAQSKEPFMNCQLCVQMATGVSKLRDLPKVKTARIGDIYTFNETKNMASHYAIDVGDGDVAEVEAWGEEVRVIPLSEVADEYGEPSAIRRPPEDAYTQSVIKASLRAPQTEAFKYSLRDSLGLYSELEAKIAQGPNKAPAASWKAYINGLTQKGVKPEEIEWSGVRDWLDLMARPQPVFESGYGIVEEQKGPDGKWTQVDDLGEYFRTKEEAEAAITNDMRLAAEQFGRESDTEGRVAVKRFEKETINFGKTITPQVTKDQVTAYLKQGGVRVEESRLYDPMGLLGRLDSALSRVGYSAEYDSFEGQFAFFPVGKPDEFMEYSELPENVRQVIDGVGGLNPQNAKYGQYTLPGGENYREVLLTLPHRGDYETPNGARFTQEELSDPVVRATVDKIGKAPVGAYRSTHWDQPNVIAHIRLNDRTDADGNKVLFVEEIQSDWGQEGKKKGFGSPAGWKATKMKGGEWAVSNASGNHVGYAYNVPTAEAAIEKMAGGVPVAPFVTKTEGWLNLALKRIMVMAAEGGYDKVAFVNGEQSADRYDLSKQIDGVGYTKNDGGTIDITVYRNRSTVMDKTMQTPAEVEDLIGKELTRKIVDSPERIGALEGLDLKVGGEGMKTFYDQIVPLAVKKLLPKVGGGQIINVGVEGKRDTGFVSGTDIMNALGIPESNQSNYWRGLSQSKRDRLMKDYRMRFSGKVLPQLGFDVTPDMKRKVETTGLPRFSLRDVSGRAAQPESKAAPEIQQGVEVQKLPYMGDDVELPSYSRLPISGKTTPRRPTLDQIESGRYSLRSQLPTSVVKAIDRTTVPRDQATFGERITKAFSPDAFSWFRSQALNRYNRLSEYDRELARQLGGTKLLADVSAESAALFSDLGAGLTAEIFGANDRIGGIPVYKNGFTKVDNRNKTIKGPLAIFAPLLELSNGDPYIFQAYQFWAGQKRGMRLDAQGKLTPFTQADIAEAKALERRYPQFKSIQAEWIKFNDGLVDFLVDTGVISAQNAAEFKRYSDYLPFYKQVLGEATQGPKIFQAIAGVRAPKQLKGGEGQLDDFLETIVRNVQASVQSGIKNVAGQRAAKVATSINMAENITAKINNATALRSQLLASGVPNTDQRILQLNDDIQNARQQMSGPLTFTVLENGLTVHYRSSDPLFMDAIKSLNLPDLPFIGLLSGPSNILRNLITKEPTFMLANMLRDSTSAWVTSGSKMTPIVDTIRNFGSALAGQNPNVEALYRAGILGGYDYASTLEASGKAFGKELRKVTKKLTPGERVAKPFTSLWDALEKGTQASDAATRAEIYKRTLEETKSSKYPNGNEAEALFRALEIMNFNRRGRSPVIRILTAAVPFLNARMQGLDVLYRTAIQPSFDKTATSEAKALQKTFFVRGMTILALSSMYWALTHDDDDYKKQEQETRDNYWLVPSLGIKIPIPFEVGVIFKVIPERIMEYAFGSDTGKDFMDSMTRQFLNTFAFNLIPQAGLPIYEVKTNHSFFTQRPIIGQGMENVADKYQVGPTTSKISQFIGEQVGLSPIKLDHLIKGYTGTLGMYAVDVMDAIMDVNSDSPKAAKRFEQMPIIKRFALDPEARGAVTNYYQLKNSVDEVVRTSNFLERSMRFEEYGEYMRDNMNMFVMRDYVNDLEKSMAEFREMKNLIRSSQIGADEKRDRLTQLGQVENMLTMKIQELKKQMSQR